MTAFLWCWRTCSLVPATSSYVVLKSRLGMDSLAILHEYHFNTCLNHDSFFMFCFEIILDLQKICNDCTVFVHMHGTSVKHKTFTLGNTSNQNKLHSHLTNFSTNAHFLSQSGILHCITRQVHKRRCINSNPCRTQGLRTDPNTLVML